MLPPTLEKCELTITIRHVADGPFGDELAWIGRGPGVGTCMRAYMRMSRRMCSHRPMNETWVHAWGPHERNP